MGDSLDQGGAVRHFNDVDLNCHRIPRHHRHEELHVINGRERYEFPWIYSVPRRVAKQDGGALADGLDD